MPTLLVIDNFDSFTYNLVQMFLHYDLEIKVVRNDGITLEEAKAFLPDYILISPGPRDPAHAGISKTLISAFYRTIPIFGVCLGMQCLNEVFNGSTVQSRLPMHGKTSMIHHQEQGLFMDMPSSFQAARYHSLVVEPNENALKADLMVTGVTPDNVIMGLSHQFYPLHGVQFHPESFMTDAGFVLVENFLKLGPLYQQLGRPENTFVTKHFRPEKIGCPEMAEA